LFSEYTVVEEFSIQELMKNVNYLLSQGFQPLGGVCMAFGPREEQHMYLQALARPKSN